MLMTAPLITRGSWPGGREIWLQEKGDLDRERLGFRKDLWCVRDKVYDLSDYLSRHPGGDGEASTACQPGLWPVRYSLDNVFRSWAFLSWLQIG